MDNPTVLILTVEKLSYCIH